MINEEKLRLMTDAEMEKTCNKREIFIAEKFYGADFVIFQTILAVLLFSAAYVMVFVIIFLNQADTILVDMKIMDILSYMQSYIWVYLILLVLVTLITVFTSTSRFWKAKDKLKKYRQSLSLINQEYKKQDEAGAKNINE